MDCRKYIEPLLDELFKRERQDLDRELERLIERNHAKGNPKHGFLYGGVFHTLLQPKHHRTAEKKLIHPELRNEAVEYMERRRELNTDTIRLRHGLSMALRPCMTPQDARDQLPNSAVSMIPELAQLGRIRPVGWAYQGPLEHIQFQETMDLLEFYISNRIL